MKLPVYVYCVWPWEPEHTLHRAPVGVTIHTRKYCLMIRPFSGFAQGGDRRGENAWRAWHDSGVGPEPYNPYRHEREGKWVLSDENPEIWERLDYRGIDFLLRRGRYARCGHRGIFGWRTCPWSKEYNGLCFKHADFRAVPKPKED